MVRYAATPANPAKGKSYLLMNKKCSIELRIILASKSRGSYLRVHVS